MLSKKIVYEHFAYTNNCLIVLMT